MTVDTESLEIFLKNTNLLLFKTYLKSKWQANGTKITPMGLKQIRAQCDKVNRGRLNYKYDIRQGSGVFPPVWKKGEYKLFKWFMALYCFVSSKEIIQLNQQDFKAVSKVFVDHSQERIKYEVHCIIPFEFLQARKWTTEQMRLLNQLVMDDLKLTKKIQWKTISFRLYQRSSGEYIRTFKECRERWMNHCNPNLNKTQWTREEDYVLFHHIIVSGKQWSRIAKQFNTQRTEHMIKNRYSSLIRSARKKHQHITLTKLQFLIFNNLKAKLQQAILDDTIKLRQQQHNQPQQGSQQQDQDQVDLESLMSIPDNHQEIRAQMDNIDDRIILEERYERQHWLRHGRLSQDRLMNDDIFEEEKFKYDRIEEIRLFRNEILDKINLCYGQLLIPYCQEQNDIVFDEEEGQNLSKLF